MKKTSMRVLATALSGAAIAAAITAAADPGIAASTMNRQATASVPACTISALSAQLYDAGLAAGAHKGTMLTLTNVSKSTCTVTGYVGPEMVNPAYPDEPTYPQNGSTYFNQDPGVHPVELSPGERASSVLAWTKGNASNGVLPKTLWIWINTEDEPLTVPFAPGYVQGGNIAVSALAAHTPLN